MRTGSAVHPALRQLPLSRPAIGAAIASVCAAALVIAGADRAAGGPVPGAHVSAPAQLPAPDDAPRLTAALGGDAMAVAAAGDRAYASIGARLVPLDISDPTAPVVLGEGWLLAGMAKDIILHDGIAYVLTVQGIQRIDLSRPDVPCCRMVSGRFPAGFALQGNYLYVAPWYFGDATSLTVIDLRDPLAPVEAGSAPIDAGCPGVAVGGGRLYLACPDDDYVRIFRLEDPIAPEPAGAIELGRPAVDVALVRDRLVVLRAGSLVVFDVSDTEAPVQLDELSADARKLAVDGDRVAILGNHRFAVVDARDPEALRYIGEIEFGQWIANGGWAVSGDRLVVGAQAQGVQLWTLGAGRSILRGGTVTTFQAGSVAVDRGAAYAADGQRLFVLDRSSPSRLEVRSELLLPAPALDLAAEDGRVYALTEAEEGQALIAVDALDPARPAIVGRIERLDPGRRLDMLANHVLGISGGKSGLQVVDVQDPRRLQLIGRLGDAGWVTARRGAGGFAFVADEDFGLRVLSLADPRAPEHIGDLAINRIGDLDVDGDRLYVVGAAVPADSSLRVLRVDVSDPSRPRRIGTWNPWPGFQPSDLGRLEAEQGRVYTQADWYYTLLTSVAMLRDGAQVGVVPMMIQGHTDMDAIDDLLYVSNSAGGLLAIHLPDGKPRSALDSAVLLPFVLRP